MAVLEFDGTQYGLVVDDLMAPEEIVVKPLSPVLREIGLFSGATVLGTGALAMILDVNAAGLRAGIRPAAVASLGAPAAGAGIAAVTSSFLIFEDYAAGRRATRKALPLSVVVRIETVVVKNIEFAGDRPLLQYRGELLSLEDRGGLLRELLEGDPEETATVLICQRPGGGSEKRPGSRMGMLVRRVVEVANGDLMDQEVEVCSERLAMVNDRLTVVHEAFTPGSRLREVA